MPNYEDSIKAYIRELRLTGLSLGQIQRQTNVPKTTIQLWTKDILQSEEQRALIKKDVLNGLQQGRIKAQRVQKQKRLAQERKLLLEGRAELAELSKREFFVAGVALYWAEGFKNKHEHRLGFCNSDPNMIKFYLRWLEVVFGVDREDIVLRLALNSSHKEKVAEILHYWVLQTGIPVTQFTKTFYQNSVWKKEYNNDEYYGVLRVHVRDSLVYLLKMRGWIDGLKCTMPR